MRIACKITTLDYINAYFLNGVKVAILAILWLKRKTAPVMSVCVWERESIHVHDIVVPLCMCSTKVYLCLKWIPPFISSRRNSYVSVNWLQSEKRKYCLLGNVFIPTKYLAISNNWPEKRFLQRRYTDGQQAYEKLLNIASYLRKANQNHNVLSCHTCQNGYHQKAHK